MGGLPKPDPGLSGDGAPFLFSTNPTPGGAQPFRALCERVGRLRLRGSAYLHLSSPPLIPLCRTRFQLRVVTVMIKCRCPWPL